MIYNDKVGHSLVGSLSKELEYVEGDRFLAQLPEGALAHIGPDIENISRAFRFPNIKFVYAFFLPKGMDTYDPLRLNPKTLSCSGTNGCEWCRYTASEKNCTITCGSVMYLPYDPTAFYKFSHPITGIMSINAWISAPPRERVAFVEKIICMNLVLGVNYRPTWFSIAPEPDELFFLPDNDTRISNQPMGYKIWRDSKYAYFNPTDNRFDSGKVYKENLELWKENTRLYCMGDKIALQIENQRKCGVMRAKVYFPVTSGEVRSSKLEPAYAITLPVLNFNTTITTFRLVQVPFRSMIKLADNMAQHDFDFSLESVLDRKTLNVANTFNAIQKHVKSIICTDDPTDDGILDYNYHDVTNAAMTFLFLQKIAREGSSFFDRFKLYFRSFLGIFFPSGEFTFEQFKEMVIDHSALKSKLCWLGYDSTEEVPDNTFDFLASTTGTDCLNRFFKEFLDIDDDHDYSSENFQDPRIFFPHLQRLMDDTMKDTRIFFRYMKPWDFIGLHYNKIDTSSNTIYFVDYPDSYHIKFVGRESSDFNSEIRPPIVEKLLNKLFLHTGKNKWRTETSKYIMNRMSKEDISKFKIRFLYCMRYNYSQPPTDLLTDESKAFMEIYRKTTQSIDVEEKDLEYEYLEKEGYYKQDVPGDGNCLFTALTIGLREPGINKQYTPTILRGLAAAYNHDNYPSFLALTESKDDYFKRMVKDGEWADHFEIQALANILEMQILVYRSDCTINQIDPATPFNKTNVVGIYYNNINHYQALVKDKDRGDPPIKRIRQEIIDTFKWVEEEYDNTDPSTYYFRVSGKCKHVMEPQNPADYCRLSSIKNGVFEDSIISKGPTTMIYKGCGMNGGIRVIQEAADKGVKNVILLDKSLGDTLRKVAKEYEGKVNVIFATDYDQYKSMNFGLPTFSKFKTGLRDLFSIPDQYQNETDDDFYTRVGATLVLQDEQEVDVLLTQFDKEFSLYDDAYLSCEEIPFSAIHRDSKYFIKKVMLENQPEKIFVRQGCFLYATPTGSSFEFRFANYRIPELEFLNVERMGVPFSLTKYCNKVFDFYNMQNALNKHPLYKSTCTHKACYLHTYLSQHSQKHHMLSKIHVTHRVASSEESKLDKYIPTEKAKKEKYRFSHFPGTYNSKDVSILNDSLVQQYMFGYMRKDKVTSSYVYQFDYDPLARLESTQDIIMVYGPAGIGKTDLVASKSTFLIAPLADVINQNKKRFVYAETYERAIQILVLLEMRNDESTKMLEDKFKINQKIFYFDTIVIDEVQVMGPILYYILAWAERNFKKVILLGEEAQGSWEYRSDTKVENFPDKDLNIFCSNESLFTITREYSSVSYRYGPEVAALATRITGMPIIGLNSNQKTEFRFAEYVDDIVKTRLDPSATYITLTQDAKQVLISHNYNACTAQESGGMNITNAVAVLLPKKGGKPLPYTKTINGYRFRPQEYIAITRATHNNIIYLPQQYHNLTLANIHLFHLKESGDYPLYEPIIINPFGVKPILGFRKAVVVSTTEFIAETLTDQKLFKNFGGPLKNKHEIALKRNLDFAYQDPNDVFVVTDKPKKTRDELDKRLLHDFVVDAEMLRIKEIIKEAKEKRFNIVTLDEIASYKPKEEDYVADLKERFFNTPIEILAEKESHRYKNFGLSNTIAVSNGGVQSMGENGTTSFTALQITLGTGVANTYLDHYPMNTRNPHYVYWQGEMKKINDIHNETLTTGQFHPKHVIRGDQLLQHRFAPNPVDNNKLYIGQIADFKELLDNYHGPYLKVDLHAACSPIPNSRAKVFSRYNISKHQRNNPTTRAATGRYGIKNYNTRLAEMLPDKRKKYIKQCDHMYDIISDAWYKHIFNKNTSGFTDTHDSLIKHAIGFLVDQSKKGLLTLKPHIASFLEGPNKYTADMKVQTKTPDGYDEATHESKKGGQPVQSKNPTHMHDEAPLIRMITEMFFHASSDKFKMMGPEVTLEQIHLDLVGKINFLKLIGFDVKECDSSHIPGFIKFIRKFLYRIYPNDKELIFASTQRIKLSMEKWFCRSRDGGYLAEVQGQLASGSAWTFVWNCLWSIFNIMVSIVELYPNNYEDIFKTMVGSTAGDDGFISIVGENRFQNGVYRTLFGVDLKISIEPLQVTYCHQEVCREGVFFDPYRLYGKIISRPFMSEQDVKEFMVSVYSLVKRYRDTEELAKLCMIRLRKHGDEPEETMEIVDLLHRLCNTPPKKLYNMMIDVDFVSNHLPQYDNNNY